MIITSAVLRQSDSNGSTLTGTGTNAYINLFDINSTSTDPERLKQVLPNIQPFAENNTWRLCLDFVNTAPFIASPAVDSYFLWEVNVLVINNNSINTIA